MSTEEESQDKLIEDAADKLDQIMDRLDQIACPDLYADLQAARSEIDELRMSLSKQTEYAEILAEKAHNMEAQRDEARHEVEARDGIYAQAAKTFVKHASDQIEIDRLRGELDKHVLKSEKRRLRVIELEAREYRQRRTIRALVVAARAMHGIGELDGYRDGWIGLVRELVREIKADSDRWAGKE